MRLTATLINLYHVCKRELWLHANEIRMEHTSETVSEGRLLHEVSYPQRPSNYEEIAIDNIKIDFFDRKKNIIHEIKKSAKAEKAHEWQLKYYILILERHGLDGVTGVLEYPELRQTTKVELTDADRSYLENLEVEIDSIIHTDTCPPLIRIPFCKSCSYYEFCYITED